MPRLSKIGAAALAAFGWTGLSSVSASYLVVAGGGGGSFGGAGAGGYLTGTASLDPNLSYSVTVGAGGAGQDAFGTTGTNGSNSVFNAITSTGGGGGGKATGTLTGNSGGSGGGGGNNGSGGAGTSGQGNAGGNGYTDNASYGLGGGGGGASAVGQTVNSGSSTGGNGGAGSASSISGSSVTYAGGGGGGGHTTGSRAGGTGGAGGGGNGSITGNASNGTSSLGGGGGGAGSAIGNGGNGGSGVVIISYAGAQQFGGGVVTSSGGNTIHTFNTSGTLSPLSLLTASYLVVAGGGGGAATAASGQSGGAGGGGAGGYLSGSSLTLDTNSIYAVTVGAGGLGATTSAASGSNGSNSSFSTVSTAAVGGGGGACNGSNNGSAGGSGGGGYGFPLNTYNGGAGTAGQGNNGGRGFTDGATYTTGGGGGGSGAAATQKTSNSGGDGGAGTANSISGTSVTYAGGGGGGGSGGAGGTGAGGGGNGGAIGNNGSAGTANLGGGGGGAGGGNTPVFNGGNGGSGVVIISYAGSTQLMAGGTVTVAGGNVIHTFTSSGYLTPIVLVNNSLRFRNEITGSPSSPAYLSRTFPTAGNLQKWTFSVWIKKTLGRQTVFGRGSTQFGAMQFESNDTLSLNWASGGTTYAAVTTQVFRDPSAWYHLVWAIDTTQAVSTARQRFYVNGTEVTAWSTYTTIPQNTSGNINTANSHWIGNFWESGFQYPFSGYMTDINFVDGEQLTPNSFGTFNGLGVWQPIRYGGSYGTNGFYLPFTATQSFTGIFSGSSQWISVPNLSAYNVGTNNYTVEGWFYITSLGSTQGLWGSNNGSGSTPKFLGLVNTSGAVLLEFTNSGGATFLTSSSGVVTTNKWYHIAWVRNSGTSTIYVNGVNVGSTATSVNLSGLTQPWNIGYIGESGPSSLTGNASNFRLVTGTAVYTSNFIPQTTPLTAISGTQILTLQNATLVDNSTNAQVVTNNGGVTVGATYPFAMLNDIVKDFGPAGNNWTANNIGETTGSTLDTMTDVPTLTSATVANYCTLSPIWKNTNHTTSNGNLTVTSSSYGACGPTMGVTTGKWYHEATISNRTSNNSGSIGFCNELFNIPGALFFPENTNGFGVNAIDGNAYSGSGTAYGTAFASGDVIMLAFDADAKKMWVGKNGTWFNSGNPVTAANPYPLTITGTTFFPCINCYGDTYQYNFGQRPFVYTPPTGYVALNTFNLPTPTIGATASTTANKYMDVTLYTGNGSSVSVTNSGSMQPDLVWGKSRSNAISNYLVDSVRGVSKALSSDRTDAEDNAPGYYVTAFNSNGFTVGLGTGLNTNGATYVGWQWRASNATAVTNTSGSITSTVSVNTTAGFSILTYTGNGTAGATIGHGLGVAPSMMIFKTRNDVGGWLVWHTGYNSNQAQMLLNSTAAIYNPGNGLYFNSTYPSSTVATLGTSGATNGSGTTYVAYMFAAIAGYSAFGTYTGNGSTDGTFVYTNFAPSFVMVKRTDTSGNWFIIDNKRLGYNGGTKNLYPNLSNAEATLELDLVSNGFKWRLSGADVNASGGTYIYMAFAESPFKYANAR